MRNSAHRVSSTVGTEAQESTNNKSTAERLESQLYQQLDQSLIENTCAQYGAGLSPERVASPLLSTPAPGLSPAAQAIVDAFSVSPMAPLS